MLVEAFQVSVTDGVVLVVAARPVGTVGGVVYTSKAPMSHPAAWGRFTPRWSVLPEHPANPEGIALMAALPDWSAIVWVGPPFEASGPSCGLVLLSALLVKPQEVALSRLYPLSVTGMATLQFAPVTPSVTMLMLSAMTPG